MFHRLFSNQKDGFWRFSCETQILFGRGCLKAKLPYIVKFLGKRIGVLTDKGVTSLPFFIELTSEIKDIIACDVMHIGFESEMTSINNAVDAFRKNSIDCILAVGGGSVLDSSKIVAVLVGNHKLNMTDLLVMDTIPFPPVPLVTVPTSFGSGSEVNMYAHFNDIENNKKVGIKKTWFTPTAAVIDPEVMDDTPPDLKYIWGVDAFCHALESGTLRYETSPLLRLLMGYAVETLSYNLHSAVENGDKDSNDKVALASVIAGLGIHNARTGLIHTLAVPLAKTLHLPHAISLFMVIHPVLKFQGKDMFDVLSLSDLLPELKERIFFRTVSFPVNEKEFKSINPEELVKQAALDSVIFKVNPVPITEKEIKMLYEEIIGISSLLNVDYLVK